jgi:Protein of unknown function DUF262
MHPHAVNCINTTKICAHIGKEASEMTTTTQSLELASSSEFSIPEIVRLASDGYLRVPNFQRPFMWNAKDVVRLFDSIYRGFPVGTLLLWRKEAPEGQVSFGPITFNAPYRPDALWVVDGQQRIISLFGALTPDWPDSDERFEVNFDLATRRFITLKHGLTRPRVIPIRDALETRRLATWIRIHDDDLESDDFNLADSLVGVIRDYRISVYIVKEDDDSLLREIFDRINSSGKPMTRAQVFHALYASDTAPGSPLSVVQELSRLRFGAIDENRVVQSLLAIRGGDVQRDFRDEFDAEDDPSDWYDRTEQALAKAIQFLRSENIPRVELMPYTLPIPVLATFFYLHPDPSPWIRRLLARWLWRSWAQGEGGRTATLRRAARVVNPKQLDDTDVPTEYETVRTLLQYVPDYLPPAPSLDHFRADAAPSKLLLLALASLRPLRPDGTEVDLAAELEEHGLKAVTELVPGYRSHAAARSFWPVGGPQFTGSEQPDVLRSHAIDDVAAARYREGNIAEFIRQRSSTLENLLRGFIQNHVEPGALVRPPLQDLMVPDPDGEGQG